MADDKRCCIVTVFNINQKNFKRPHEKGARLRIGTKQEGKKST